MDVFYMIWSPQGNPPAFRHPSYNEAYRESIRLADENPSMEFFILKAISSAKVRPVLKASTEDLLEPPF